MTPLQRDRRERLLKAGLAGLEDDDYEKVQVKEIADRAGVSLGTLYNYFSSKERFFAEVMIRWADNLPLNVRNHPPAAQASPAERLKNTLRRALRAFEKQPQMARLINVLVMSTDPLAAGILDRLNQSTTDAYMQALAGIDPTRARRMIDVINAVFGSVVREWSQGRLTIGEVRDRIDSAVSLVVGD
jgi:AcrR family transcriptional regulator